CQLHNSHPWTF
nr:immunoglobulin light chain junction region [Macaca mulatta]MOW51515.1 immunoglobulin light chain junction region [Macaca mulatta]MOW51516.1 immunoglobulin light chain junction region [Macaca mulatta]MOW51578.1 immunoglobulin light chain junction region [Macaca mulatta]MOW51699.1 immunoglobulin light chain junction region [Macaca mulatta]